MRYISLLSLLFLCACTEFQLAVDAKDGDKELKTDIKGEKK